MTRFYKQIKDQLQFSPFLADLIEDELKKKDINLTFKQKKQLIDELDKHKENLKESLSIQINDDGTVQVTDKSDSTDLELDIFDGAKTKIKSIRDLC